MDWSDLNPNTRDWMKILGEFGPTVHAQNAEIKGVMYDADADGMGRVYIASAELRELAKACIEVADWLDKRKAATPSAEGAQGMGANHG